MSNSVGHVTDGFLHKDICIDDVRRLIFAINLQMSTLMRAKIWYVDAMFHVVQCPFTQIFTVNAFVCHSESTKQLPLVMCLMSCQCKEDYMRIMEALQELVPGSRVK